MNWQLVAVKVFRSGRLIKQIERPLHIDAGSRAVAYKGKLWLLKRGNRIDVDQPPLEIQEKSGASAEKPSEDRSRRGEKSKKKKAPSALPRTTGKATNDAELRQPQREGIARAVSATWDDTPLAGVEASPVQSGNVNSGGGDLKGSPRKPTAEQEPIVAAPAAGRLLVLAGPGTGKTETVAQRLLHLLRQGMRPAEVLVLSFSRNAVSTLSRRVADISGSSDSPEFEDVRHLTVRTFDSWAFRILRQLQHPPGDLLRRGYQQNIALLIQEMKGPRREEVLTHLSRLRHIVVDEFQDLSGARGALVLELLELVAPPGTAACGFTVLGDASQAIYGFTLDNEDGAEFKDFTSKWLLESLRKRYKAELREFGLTVNKRASPALAGLVATARQALQVKGNSAEHKLAAMTEIVKSLPAIDGDALVRHACDGARTLRLGVLCRTNGEALRLASMLSGKEDKPPKVQVRVAAGSPSATVPAWIGATLGLFKGTSVGRAKFDEIYRHLYPSVAKRRAIGVPEPEAAWSCLVRAGSTDGHGAVVELQALRERLWWKDFLPDDEGFPPRLVEVLTVHQSKGMEYDEVVMLDDDDDGPDNGNADPEEEANLLFVALSRAASRIAVCSRDQVYQLRSRTFQKESRRRWCTWKNNWVNIEIGISGDLNPCAPVSTSVWDSADKARGEQEWLAAHAADLIGHKVVLVKASQPGQTANKFIYNVCLQEDQQPTRVLGQTMPQLTFDLLSIISSSDCPLPQKIYNLRISDATTMTAKPDDLAKVHSPWKESGVWAGVQVHGLGAFKTYKRS